MIGIKDLCRVVSAFFFSGKVAEVFSEIARVNVLIVYLSNRKVHHLIMWVFGVLKPILVPIDTANDFPHNAVKL